MDRYEAAFAGGARAMENQKLLHAAVNPKVDPRINCYMPQLIRKSTPGWMQAAGNRYGWIDMDNWQFLTCGKVIIAYR